MAQRTCRVGLHGRNNVTFEELDYRVVQTAGIEALKMMGQTRPQVFQRLQTINPRIDFVTRLYDDRFGVDRFPSPAQFAERQIPLMNALRPYCQKFEVHNEPNHPARYEGWGQEDQHARSFNDWFLNVYDLLKKACPWASLGFPGLAIPHRDLEWIKICRPAVNRADWLGVHCYWQTPANAPNNHLSDGWGLRFKAYHAQYPDKVIEITECGNSNVQSNIPISDEALARQYVEYFQALFQYPYLNSACFFILSSQDSTWSFFSWRTEDGRIKPVVDAVGAMNRPTLVPIQLRSPEGGEPPMSVIDPVVNAQITDLSATLPKSPSAAYPTRSANQIRQIIIHHSAINSHVGPERIAQVQVQQGKPAISYHYFIGDDGKVYQTNPPTVVSAHTAGQDQNSLAICFAGNFTDTIPSEAQLKAGGDLISQLLSQFNIPVENLKGASELIATQSPGQQWLQGQRWKNLLLARVTTRPAVVTTPTDGSTDRITELNRHIAELTAQLAQARANYDNATKKIATLTQQVNQLQTQLAQAQTQAQQVSTLNNRINQLVTELAQARSENQSAGAASAAQIAGLNNRIAQLQAELAAARTTQPGAVPRPAIQDVAASLPHHPSRKNGVRSTDEINAIVIHHTVVSPDVSLERIAQSQVDAGRPSITYHYYIMPDGETFQTNPDDVVTQHTADHSQNSLAIAFAGNFTATVPTDQQLQAGAALIAYLQSRYDIPRASVQGASELVNTQSPGRQWLEGQQWKNMLLARLDAIAGAGPTPIKADSGQVAALQARIADLELQLNMAQEAVVSVGDASAAPQAVVGVVISQPRIEDIVSRLPKHASRRYESRSVEAINSLIIHHSAVPASIPAERIADFNVNRNDWPGIGFHYFIGADGVIQQTNDLTTVSFHAGNQNGNSVGIAFAGDFDEEVPSTAQITAGAHLIAWLLDHFDLPVSAIHGHSEYANTSCPGQQWHNGANWQNSLLKAVQDHLAGAGPRSAQPDGKALHHYLLFWQTADDWAKKDLEGALNYIAKFRPTLGFSVDDAIDAEYVTIVGGPLGVSAEAEAQLRAAGCQVERIAGNSEAATKALLDNLATRGRRFLRLQES